MHALQNQPVPLHTDQQAEIQARNALAALVFPLERSTRMRELKHLGADAKAGLDIWCCAMCHPIHRPSLCCSELYLPCLTLSAGDRAGYHALRLCGGGQHEHRPAALGLACPYLLQCCRVCTAAGRDGARAGSRRAARSHVHCEYVQSCVGDWLHGSANAASRIHHGCSVLAVVRSTYMFAAVRSLVTCIVSCVGERAGPRRRNRHCSHTWAHTKAGSRAEAPNGRRRRWRWNRGATLSPVHTDSQPKPGKGACHLGAHMTVKTCSRSNAA
jgi:hypothetical protein